MHVNIFLIFQGTTLIPFIFLNKKTFLTHFSMHMKLNFRKLYNEIKKKEIEKAAMFFICAFFITYAFLMH